MDVIDVALPRSVIRRAQKLTGEESPRAAITALVREREGHIPNAATVRALRSKKRGTVFNNAKDAIAHLKSL